LTEALRRLVDEGPAPGDTPLCHTAWRRSCTSPAVSGSALLCATTTGSLPDLRAWAQADRLTVAQIIRRQSKGGEPRYDVRIRVGGRVVTKTFRRRRDADAYAATVEAGRLRGLVLDPREARLTVDTVATRWLASNPAKRPTTWVADDLALRQYVLPSFGTRHIGSVTPAIVRVAWLRRSVISTL